MNKPLLSVSKVVAAGNRIVLIKTAAISRMSSPEIKYGSRTSVGYIYIYIYAEALGEAGFLKAKHYLGPSKFGVELVRPTETNPQEINVATETKDDYEGLGDMDDIKTPTGDDDIFDDLFAAAV